MSSMKTKTSAETDKTNREVLNTTINAEVLNDFKIYCKEIRIPMNTILETFMRQFAKKEFILKFDNADGMNVEIQKGQED